MTIGPGKYDDLATVVRLKTNATAVILIVIEGNNGSGFSAQLPEDCAALVPDLLEKVAKDMRGDLARQQQ